MMKTKISKYIAILEIFIPCTIMIAIATNNANGKLSIPFIPNVTLGIVSENKKRLLTRTYYLQQPCLIRMFRK